MSNNHTVIIPPNVVKNYPEFADQWFNDHNKGMSVDKMQSYYKRWIIRTGMINALFKNKLIIGYGVFIYADRIIVWVDKVTSVKVAFDLVYKLSPILAPILLIKLNSFANDNKSMYVYGSISINPGNTFGKLKLKID